MSKVSIIGAGEVGAIQRIPSRHRVEEHLMLNLVKYNRKLMNNGMLKDLFRRLLERGELCKQVSQWRKMKMYIDYAKQKSDIPDYGPYDGNPS